MHKAVNFGQSWIDLEFDFPCEIHHCHPRGIPNPKNFRVLTLYTEPSIHLYPTTKVRLIHEQFDLILTRDPSLLDLPNARLTFFGGSWVFNRPIRKEFSVSFLYSPGGGADLAGYRLRKAIWQAQTKISIPIKFYTSALRPPTDVETRLYPFMTKDNLFESMFHLTIENESEKNFFTEKIIDCFKTYTIPLYYGCPNIADFFEADGIVPVHDVSQVISVLNNLDPNYYWSRLNSVLNNHNICFKFDNLLEGLRYHITDAFLSKRWPSECR